VASLIDTDSRYEAVFSLHRHEVLGFLIGAYVVQTTAPGTFGLKFNRLLPENLDRYGQRLSDNDRELVRQLDELVLQNLYKKFRRKESSLQQFMTEFPDNPNRRYIVEYVERRVANALTRLSGSNFYLMSKDGFPALRKLRVLTEPAAVAFRIARTDIGLEYEAQVTLNGKRLPLHTKMGGVVGIKPPYLWHDDEIFPVADLPDARRLKPFFRQPVVQVPKLHEEEYFRKFIRKLVEDCEIEAQGFGVQTIEEPAQFSLEVLADNSGTVTLKPRVQYGTFVLPVDAREKFRVDLEERPNGSVSFHRIRRDRDAELHFTERFESLRTDGVSLIDFILPAAKAHAWVAEHLPALQAEGIRVVQQFGDEEFTFAQPDLAYELLPLSENAHELRADVVVAEQRIPLHMVRAQLLRGDTKLRLPDGRFLYLPQPWADDFRHLLEVARPTENGLRLEGFQLPLLRIAAKGKGAELPTGIGELTDLVPVELPQGLNATLRDYQKAGFDWLCWLRQNGFGGILADDMGLGKTVQTLSLLLYDYEKTPPDERGPALIVVPNSLIFNWVDETARFTPALTTLVYKGQRRQSLQQEFFRYQLVISTYGTVRQDVEELREVPFRYVVLDESHTIKNREAKTTRAILELRARYRLSLTGTPIENTTMDLWTQMEFLNPGLLGTAPFFERHYANAIEKERNEERALKLRDLTKPFILRRTKDMVAQDLPERVEQTQPCEMAPAQERLYSRTSTLYRKTLFAGKDDAAVARNKLQVLASIQRLRQIAIHPLLVDPLVSESGKYEVVLQLLEEVIASGAKVLVFSSFVKLLKIVQADLRQRNIPHCYLDGSQRPEDRAAEVARFQADANVPVFLLSLKAGGTGLNLTAAQYVFLLDPWWNPAVEQQAINRAHRIGQGRTVFVYQFITRGSIEEKIVALQRRKQRIADEVIRTEAQFFKALSKNDLEQLFT
jgi:hypothetical protein